MLFRTGTASRSSASGRLIYIMGPSGAGKDSLIDYARARKPAGVKFATRCITRSADYGGELHQSLSLDDFHDRLQQDLFALTWQAHDTWYGIGVEIDAWLQQGLTVVVSGSRAALAQAEERYPRVRPILITASPEVLRSRLLTRGRENDQGVDQRMRRARDLACSGSRPVCVIENSGPMAVAGELLLACLI